MTDPKPASAGAVEAGELVGTKYYRRTCPRCGDPQVGCQSDESDAMLWWHDEDGGRRDGDQCEMNELNDRLVISEGRADDLRAKLAEAEGSGTCGDCSQPTRPACRCAEHLRICEEQQRADGAEGERDRLQRIALDLAIRRLTG